MFLNLTAHIYLVKKLVRRAVYFYNELWPIRILKKHPKFTFCPLCPQAAPLLFALINNLGGIVFRDFLKLR